MNYSDIYFQFKRYALNEKGMRPRSCKAILSCMHDLCNFARSDDLKDLQEGMIREFLHTGREEKLWSAKTYRNRWQHMSTFFDWGVRRKFCKINPLKNIEKPKLPQNLPRCLTQEQMQTVLNTVRWMDWIYSFSPIRNEAIISTFVFTGIRLNELLNIEMSDVNIRQGEILIRQGKNRKDRIVPIHPRLRSQLENSGTESDFCAFSLSVSICGISSTSKGFRSFSSIFPSFKYAFELKDFRISRLSCLEPLRHAFLALLARFRQLSACSTQSVFFSFNF